MKIGRLIKFGSLLLLGSALVFACTKEIANIEDSDDLALKKGQPAQTAQSVMINVDGATNFVIDREKVWAFKKNTAETFFEGGTKSQRKQVAEDQMCTFWNGGTLVSAVIGEITITPVAATNPVAAQTAWKTSTVSTGLDVDVNLDITIAGESFMKTKKWGKYSFTLKNPYDPEFPEADLSRITELKIELMEGEALLETIMPAHELIEGNDDNNCLLDFPYYGNAGFNAGSNGEDVLEMLHMPGELDEATIGEILASDNFNKNDGGCGNTCIGVVEPITFTLGKGKYTVVVTGKVKGNDGTVSLKFKGTYNIILGPDPCQD